MFPASVILFNGTICTFFSLRTLCPLRLNPFFTAKTQRTEGSPSERKSTIHGILQYCRISVLLSFFCLMAFPQLISANDNANKIASVIVGYRGAYGHPMSEKDFFEITGSSQAGIGFSDITGLWMEFQKSQMPPITKKNLLTIVKTNRAAFVDIQYKYNLLQTPIDIARSVKRKHETGRYAFSNEKVLISVENDHKNGEYINNIMSFDGTVVRYVNLATGDPFASIEPPSRVDGMFFPSTSLLSVSSMLDTKRYFGKSQAYNDFVGMLESDRAVVLEEVEFLDGEECVIITDGNYRMYASPQKNYSIVCKECWVRRSMPGDRILLSKAVLSDFHEHENSFWMPQKYYEEIFSEEGKLVTTIQVVFQDVMLNSKIADKFFQDIIPENSFVSDGVRGLTYLQSDSPSINELLKSVAKSKRVWTFQIISVTLGIIMIIVALIRMYLKRRNAT